MHNLVVHLFQALAATGAIFASESLISDGWIVSIEKLGLAVALVVFFVITGWMREQRMAKRIDWLEKENDKLGIRVAALTEQVNLSVSTSAKLVGDAMQTLNNRTCWACESRDEFIELQRLLAERRARR